MFAYLLLAFVYHVKHKKLDQEITFIQMVTENGFFNQRNIWFGYYALGISLLLFIGTHLQIDRFMWATFASSSLFSGYDTFRGRYWFSSIGYLVILYTNEPTWYFRRTLFRLMHIL